MRTPATPNSSISSALIYFKQLAGVVGRESGEVRLDELGSAGGEELEEVIDDTCLGETMVNTGEWGTNGYNRVGGRHGRIHRTVDHSGPKCTWAIDADGDGVREVHCNPRKVCGRGCGTFCGRSGA